jgi:alpha-maltose-1-phosphate synthase
MRDDTSRVPLPALRFEPEAFQMLGSRIMGRQSAGEGLLRAMVQHSGSHPLVGFGPRPASGQAFHASVKDLDKTRTVKWISSDDLPGLSNVGAIHLPDPSLAEHADLRTRAGSAAFSITGVTHTISSSNAMKMLSRIVMAPIMPWDGLICTSRAVKAAVEEIFAVQEHYAKWKFGTSQRLPRPEMPVIPLGVHSDEFTTAEGNRDGARLRLGISADEVVYMFLGRLSFHAKAHPYQMYTALEHVAASSGKAIVILQCGWFANDHIERAFKSGAAKHCPSVRQVWLDGRKDEDRRAAWSACDVFVSLSDNIQETFGLTLIEAMAAGKPVIASDWDGYRETVKTGETGVLVPTIMPPPRVGEELGLMHAAGTIDYDRYIGLCSQMVSVDQGSLRSAMLALAENNDLRRRMGLAGRARAEALFDWKVVIGRYRELWAELHRRRTATQSQQAPQLRGVMADQLPPFRLFAGYSSHRLLEGSTVRLIAQPNSVQTLLQDVMFSLGRHLIPNEELISRIVSAIAEEGQPVRMSLLARKLDIGETTLFKILSVMAKLEVIEVALGVTADAS